MYDLFRECNSLISLDLSSFNTSSVNSFSHIFSGCNSLTSLDLRNFNTSLSTNFINMFSKCYNLKYLYIDNFSTLSINSMAGMFSNCWSLLSLNLTNFNTSLNTNITDMFFNCNVNLTYCLDDKRQYPFSSLLTNYRNDCNYICSYFYNYRFIKEKTQCIDNCTNDEHYLYEYKNQCYEQCPNNSKLIVNTYSCVESCPNNYKLNNNCEYKYPQNSEEFEREDIDICSEDSPYLYNNNSCIKDCSALDFLNHICKISNSNLNIKQNLIQDVINNLKNGTLNDLLSNVINGDKKDIIISEKNILYQITSSDNQNNKEYENISTIELGECENILKDKYNISRNESLIIFKTDYFVEGLYTPIINYLIFHPKTKEELNMNYCQNTTIIMNIPISIDEKDLEKHDPSSDYYNDKCYPYTSENGIDITLYDRKNEYNQKNMSLCSIGCEFNGYNSETKKAKCECGMQQNNTLSLDSIINNKEVINKFIDIKKTANLDIIKCYKLLFTKEGLIYNIGSYILISILFIFLILFFAFYFKGFKKLKNKIYEIKKIKKENELKININNCEEKGKKRNEKKKKKEKREKKLAIKT